MGFTKRILRSIVCAVTISQTLILLANNSSNVLFSSDPPRRNFFAEREYDPDLARVLPGSVPVVLARGLGADAPNADTPLLDLD